MYRALRFISASTFVLSAGAGLAADIPCQASDPVTHRETGFHFANVAKSHKWRASITDNGLCTQVVYSFLAADDPANKSGNDFKAEKATSGGATVPGCNNPQPLDPVFTGGKIEIYCSTVSGAPRRWGTVAVWTASPDYHGGAYSFINANTSTTPEPMYTGTGVDPINQHQKFTYFLAAEP